MVTGRSPRTPSTALIIALCAACAQTPDAAQDGPPSSVDLQSTRTHLLDERTISVQYVEGGTPEAPEYTLRLPASALASSLRLACHNLEVKRTFFRLVNGASDASASQSCEGLRGTYSTASGHAGWKEQLALLCAGHWAAQIAESETPTYVLKARGTVISSQLTLPQAWTELNPDYSDEPRVEKILPVPSPSDAVSWALLATDLFRESAVLGAQLLDPATCPDGGLSAVYAARSGDSLPVAEVVSGNLAEALFAMEEAAETSRKLLAAASAARLAQERDALRARIGAWRDRTDSRLESALLYVHVPADRFEGQGLKELWRMYDRSRGLHRTTTAPDQAPQGFERDALLGYAYGTSTPPAPGLAPLRTWLSYDWTTKKTRMYTSSHFSEDAGPRGYNAGGQLEGYLVATAQPGTRQLAEYRSAANDDDPTLGFLDEPPPGRPQRIRAGHFVYTSRPSGGFPVVTATPLGDADRRAEEWLRSTRVDPRLNAERGVEELANDLLAAMRADYPGTFDRYSTVTESNPTEGGGSAFLAAFDVSLVDLERAALRLTQEAAVLGRAIVPVPNSKEHRVFGTGRSFVKANPWYLFAQTEGQGVPPEIWSSSLELTPEYARKGIFRAIDYVLEQLPAATRRADLADSAAPRLLASVEAWGSSLVEGRAIVGVTDWDRNGHINMADVRILLPGVDSKEELKARYDAWLGTEGLACALGQLPASSGCRERTHFREDGWDLEDLSTSRGGKAARLNLQGAPAGAFGTVRDPAYPVVYVTRQGPASVDVLVAFRLEPVPDSLNTNFYSVPISSGLLRALSETLAADPSKPEASYMTCAGVPRDVKVKLGDELAPGSRTPEGADASFSYYLQQAEEAAREADTLGEQLVQQGLEMDIRAEAAREQLEDLCGGVVNVGGLANADCGDDCDFDALLTHAAESAGDPAVRGDLQSVRQCLGLTPEPPVWAAIGDRKLCVWEYRNGTGKDPSPACGLPEGVSPEALPGLADVPCPALLDNGARCADIYTWDAMREADDPSLPEGYTGFVRRTIDRRLNMWATERDFAGDRPAGAPKFLCKPLLELRNGLLSGAGAKLETLFKTIAAAQGLGRGDTDGVTGLEWLTQEQLADIGWGMAYKADLMGYGKVTIGGRDLARAGTESGPMIEGVGCKPHPYIQGLLDKARAAGAAGDDVTADAAYAEYQALCGTAERSLLCGGYCRDDDPSFFGDAGSEEEGQARRVYNGRALGLAYRLSRAVRALHLVSGGWGPSTELAPFAYENTFGDYERYVQAGTMPAFHYAAGLPRYNHVDQRAFCFDDGERWECKAVLPALQAEEYFNPTFLWDERSCNDVEGVAYPGCGAMLALLDGRTLSVNATTVRRPECDVDGVWCEFSLPGTPDPEAAEAELSDLNERIEALRAQIKSCDRKPRRGERRRCRRKLAKKGIRDKLDAAQQAADDLESQVPPRVRKGERGAEIFRLAKEADARLEGCLVLSDHPHAGQVTKSATTEVEVENDLFDRATTARVQRMINEYECEAASATVGESLRAAEVLDGLDLACAVMDQNLPTCDTLLREYPRVTGEGDMRVLRKLARCMADEAERLLERMFLVEIPEEVVQALQDGQLTSVFPRNRGAFGQTLGQLVATIHAMKDHHRSVVAGLREFQGHLGLTDTQLRALDLEQDFQRLEEMKVFAEREQNMLARVESALRRNQAIWGHAMSCIGATLNALPGLSVGFSFGSSGFGGSIGLSQHLGANQVANVTCSSSEFQTALEEAAGRVADASSEARDRALEAALDQVANRQQLTDVQKDQALLELAQKFAQSSDMINAGINGLQSSYAQVHSLLAQLESERGQAHRAAAKVMLLENDAMGRVYNVNTTMRARMNTLRMRYQQARERAVRMAYLARRAIEQKVGFDLSEMDEAVAWVDAPATWADELCTLGGIDYDEIRDPNGAPRQEGEDGGYSYAKEFIGDYVARLKDFIEAYRVAYPFQDGEDVVVVSLRDELLGVRDSCRVEGPNELLHTVDLDAASWQSLRDDQGRGLARTLLDEGPFVCAADPDGRAARCRGGQQPLGVALEPAALENANGTQGEGAEQRSASALPQPALVQVTALNAGRYWLSWYEQAASCAATSAVTPFVEGVDVPLRELDAEAACHEADLWQADGWVRRQRLLELSHFDYVRVGFMVADEGVVMAAPQLEREQSPLAPGPSDFVATDFDTKVELKSCADEDGDRFRERYWRYGCEAFCPAGTGANCANGDDIGAAAKRCYYETTFLVSQEAIEKGELVPQAGFAKGNFNYRWSDLALNAVGTELLDCGGSPLQNACYANNFLQYSLQHSGPFRVRNHEGFVYQAPLYTGLVESAKGLVAERLITNPLSSADRQLLTDYWRRELAGRPLEGSYTLRIYDTPELNFGALEDIQLVLKYRYWTRLGREGER